MGIDQVGHRPAVFLDRDGVLNHNILNPETGAMESPKTAEQFHLIPGVLPAMQELERKGYLLFVVSNQPDYAKGKSTLEHLRAIHGRLEEALRGAGINLREAYYCFHHPHGIAADVSGPCACRKPSPYFLQQAAEQYGIDLTRSWMVGDRITDVECGHAAGVHTIFLHNGAVPPHHGAEEEAATLSEAVQFIPEIRLSPGS